MKKLFFLIGFIFVHAILSYAYYEKNYPITVKQPDGTEIKCFITGDEFYQRVHDAADYTLIRDEQTGFVVYAKLQNDELVSTGYVVGSVDPASVGLTPGVIISAEKRMQLRSDFLKPMKNKPVKNGYRAPKSGWNDGTLNNLVIYVRFADEDEFQPKGGTYNNFFNQDEPGYSSMYAYFKAVSDGKTLIPSTFYPISSGNTIISYQDIQPRSYYQPYSAGNPDGYKGGDNGTERGRREHALLKRAVEYVESEIPADLDLDFNGDELVDNICFLVSGAPTDWATLLWPHRWALFNEAVFINGIQVWDYNFLIEEHLDWAGSSVLSHEMFHTLSAPDLYRYNNTNIDPVGPWDLMASNTTPPQSTSAHMKWKYGGWIDDIPEITENGTYTLHNVWSEENYAYRIASPNSPTEYFVIEYRDTNVYWDSDLPGSGLVIYRINTLADGNADGPPDEVYVFRYGGKSTTTNGEIRKAFFSSNSGRTEFSNVSNPPCFLSNNQFGGIAIGNISESGGETMTFDVNLNMPSSEISVNQTLLTFAGIPIGTTSEAQTLTVSGTDLVGPIFYEKSGYGNEFFIIEETDWNSETGGTLSIRFAPENSTIYSVKLILKTLGAKEVTVSLKGSGSVAIDEQEMKNASIYPNPSTGMFNVSAKESTLLQVFSLDGKMVKEQTINQETQVDLANQPAGVYLFKFENQNTGMIETKKVMLEK